METLPVNDAGQSCVDCKTFLTCRKMGEVCKYFENNFITQKEAVELEAEMNTPLLEPLADEVFVSEVENNLEYDYTQIDEAGFEREDKV